MFNIIKSAFLLLIIFLTKNTNAIMTGQIKKKILGNLQFAWNSEELFILFVELFNKNYTLTSEEGKIRFENFKKSHQFVTNNTNKDLELSLNEYSDMSHEEFKEKKLNSKFKNFKLNSKQKLKCDCNIKQHIEKKPIDWKHLLLPPRDQKDCGSCWAFSTVASIEAQIAKVNNIKKYLSVQELLDCSKGDNAGCNGGFPNIALDYIKEFGISKEKDYSYKIMDSESCLVKDYFKKYKIKDYKSCGDLNDDNCTFDKWYDLLSKGPIIVAIDSSSKVLQHYSSGVIKFSQKDCKEVNHAVLAVGYNNNIITIRNSWGENWGEGGYFRVKRDDIINSCYLTSEAYLPLI